MTTEERIAAIRERLEAAEPWLVQHVDDVVFQSIDWLLTYTAALRAVAEAAERMREPTRQSSNQLANWLTCTCCYRSGFSRVAHAPDCPWLQLQSALQRVAEVRR